MAILANTVMIVFFYTAFLFNFNGFYSFPSVNGALVTNPSYDESEIENYKDVVQGKNMDSVSRFHEGSQNGLDELSIESRLFSQMNEDEETAAPYIFVIHPDDEIGHKPNQTRFRRFPKSCNDSIPKIKNAVITCWAWPNYINCEMNCSHGYAMKEDGKIQKSTTRKCRESRPRWQPSHYFPTCEPFINCNTVLNTPGTLVCKSKPPAPRYCEIKCEAYEDREAVPERRYECIDDKYAETLPHCASLGKKQFLIQPPE